MYCTQAASLSSGVSAVFNALPIDDILFHPDVIRRQDRSCAKSGPEFSCFWAPNFKGKDSQISDPVSQITLAVQHVGKFGGNRPRYLQDYASKIKD